MSWFGHITKRGGPAVETAPSEITGKDSKDHWIAKTDKLSGQEGSLAPAVLFNERIGGGKPPFLTPKHASGSGPDCWRESASFLVLN